MLILSRKLGETLVINENIRITILDVTNNQVRLGIEAPRNIAVDREEIYQRKVTEVSNSGAATTYPENKKEVTVIRKKPSFSRLYGRRDA